MLDIDADFIRQSLRSAKFAIAVGETLKEFRQSQRSVVSVPGYVWSNFVSLPVRRSSTQAHESSAMKFPSLIVT